MRHGVVRRWSALVLPFTFLLPVCVRGQEVTAQAPSSAIAGVNVMRHPREEHLTRGKPFHGDVRTLPQVPPTKFERPEFEEPEVTPVPYPGTAAVAQSGMATSAAAATLNAPAPTPSSSFEGLDFANWGGGHPPDTNGDVGPQHYIQTINFSVGIYGKNGVRLAAFTFNSLMSQGNFGNLCDTNNFGDPVVLYDTFEDRWILTDFAFKFDGSGNIIAPAYQCFAVSKSGDPVAGGWNFYSISSTSGFGDYPKFGLWPDGLYMSANLFGFGAGGSYQNVRVWAFNKAQMYAGEPTVQILSFDAPSAEFTLLPSNARLQTGTPPAGSPNYFAVVWQYFSAVSVYKFHVDWTSISTSTFSGPFISITPTWWAQYSNSNSTTVPSPANRLDSLYLRLMAQNQYTNLGGVESLWASHTVGAGNPTSNVTSTQAAVRYYQVKVTGGSVEASATQSFTYSPDAAVFRFMPSVAVDRAGDMAIGYSASSATLKPAIRYAARLAGDPVNSITQTEQSLIEGTGSQSGICGSSSCIRWGDYSAMTLDVDGCTFWYTNLYYQTTGLNFNTRIGTFSLPGCTGVVTGSLQGTVTAAASGNPISGATVEFGSRTATTDVNGNYSFAALASGVYPSVATRFPGYNSKTAANIVVSDGAITTQNFALTAAATSGCFTDTTQADFQAGVPSNCDLTGSPGDVILANPANIDQQNTTVTTSGFGFTATSWAGQTFKAGVSGQLTRVDLDLFCSGCTGTTPDITVSIRATTGSPAVPTGADLATATITGFSSGSGGYFTANFSSPPTLIAGTTYAVIFRATSNPSVGTYAYVCSCTSPDSNPFANGQQVTSTNSGSTWTADSTSGGRDLGFTVFMMSGFASSGTLVSSTKDANPAPGANVNWSTLSWTADTPTGTAIQFQVAASNNADGPFNFVGPDGTAGTFFTNGGSLAQFTGQRYLKYQASLSTTSSAVTPTLHDVSVCFSDLGPSTLAVAAASGPVGGTADLSATLTSAGAGVSGKSISFKLNGNDVGSAISDASGNATVAAVSLAGISAGSYPGAVTAAFAGDSAYGASSGSGTLTVQKLAQTITFGALANKTFGNPDFGVSATASSGLTVTFAVSGNCSVTGATVHLSGAGSCTITASQVGDGTYGPAANVQQSFSIAKAAQTITFGALANKMLGDPDFTVSATASSGLAVTFAASGNCTVTGSTVHISGAGSCTITASQAGDNNYNPAADVPRSFSILTSGVLPANGWRVLYVDSQETSCTNEAGTKAIDGNPGTMWVTQWCNSGPATPHEIQIDLGANYTISGFQYLPRQDPYSNGNIANYEFYVSTNGVNWGTAVSTGTLMASASDHTQKQVTFTGTVGRYVRLRALTEVNGGPWTNVAELNVLGSAVATSGPQVGSLTLSPASIAGGGTISTATVTLTSAPLANATVTLASSNPAAATVPATVTVNAGTTSANFTVTSASSVSATALSVINASYNGSTAAALLTVTPGTSATAPIPHNGWRVLYVDSQETGCVNQGATNAIDGNPSTMWVTQWCNSAPPTPHEIQIDLGAYYTISGFQYLPRQDQYFNGNIRDYEFYVSTDGVNWGNPVANGKLITSSQDKSLKQVTFTGVVGRYVRLRALSEVNGGPWTDAAEINVLGTVALSTIPRAGWRLVYVDSQETNCTNQGATNAFDGNPATMWVTEWCNSAPPTPHEIQIDLGASYSIIGFQYLPRQDQYSNGNIANYEFYVSTDGVNWGNPASSGTLITKSSDHSQKQVTFAGTVGRYVRLRALTEVNGGPWTVVAELNVLGSAVATSGAQVASVILTPASIAAGGDTSTASVTLTSAPLTDVSMALTSSNPGAATVPATVAVSAGTITASFPVTSASTVSTTVTSVIGATVNGSNGTAILTVTPPSLASIPQSGWRVLYVDSVATCGNGGATNAIDGNPGTTWFTEWCKSSPPAPHEIQIDLGASYTISGFQYLPRQDQYSNGNIANYEFYVSMDGVNWGTAVASGTLMTSASDHTQKQVTFTGTAGRYVRLRALTEVTGGPWTAVAELNVLGAPVWSGLLAPSRAINWSSAGVTGGIPNRTTVCATINPYAGPADAINTAIANCPSGQVVYLNAGIYHLSTGIVMQENVTLRGAGADQTFLVFTLSDVAICTLIPTDICFQKHPLYYGSGEVQPGGSNAATWTAGYAKGTTQITLSNIGSSGLSVGQYIFLDQANDIADNGSLFVCDTTSPFACSALGSSPGRNLNGVDRSQIQIVKITDCTPSCTSGSTFTITPGLYAGNWSAAKNPGAWWMSPIQSAGLEDLSIDNNNNGAFTGGAVMLAGAMNCWIKGVRSISPGYYRNHVWLFQSAHNTVQDSYFYGVLGTSSRGVESGIASDDLIMNNIFQNVDTPLLAGTSEAEVYGYNFSINDNYSGVPSLLNQSTDVHGAGTIYNLFESNNGNGFRADVMQGAGGLNTLFRNRYNGWESGKTQSLNPIIISSYNRYENLIGNVLGQSGVQTAYENSDVPIYDIGRGDCCDGVVVADDSIVVSTMMRWGNYDTVNRANRFLASEVPSGIGAYANPVPAGDTLPPSFFLNAKPGWWGTMPWPAVGPDVTGGDIPDIDGHAYKLPAQLCYDNATKDANGVLIDFNADRCYAAAGPPESSALAVTPTEISFGDVAVGNTQTLAITISNPGTTSTIVSAGTASGTGFAIVSPTFPLALAAGANQVVTISFSPQSIGSITGGVTFTSNAASSPVVSLVASGNGITPITCFTVAPTDVSFGTAILGFTSLQSVTLSNTGNTSLTLSSTTVTGAGYSVTNPALPITIPVGFSQPITISFTPPGDGPSSGTVTFNTNATCTPAPPVALTGTGGFASGHTATLNWTASTTATDVSYNVYRSTTSGILFQKINVAPVTGTTFVDSSLASGQTYFWVITALGGDGTESSYSTEISATVGTP